MKIGAVIQARMSSQRLPAKVLTKISGKPLLAYLLERLERCSTLDKIVVATSVDKSDDAIENFCKEYPAQCYRGPLSNVALRFKEVLNKYRFDSFVRVSADSPLLDPALVDQAVEVFKKNGFDIVTNVLKRSYPAGESVEVLKAETFLRTYPLMCAEADLEHVTRYFYRNQGDFKIFNLTLEKDYSAIQLSVDTAEDLKAVAGIIERMDKPHWYYGVKEILNIKTSS